ncbi:MAG: hypothetical protein ACI4KN_09270, partial [Gemmiger sp.]
NPADADQDAGEQFLAVFQDSLPLYFTMRTVYHEGTGFVQSRNAGIFAQILSQTYGIRRINMV